VSVRHDIDKLDAALQALVEDTVNGRSGVFGRAPFQRARIMPALFRALGLPPLTWCCVDDSGMPPPVAVEAAVGGSVPGIAGAEPAVLRPGLKRFEQYCAKCHRGIEPFPPNFLHGTAEQIDEQIGHCAPRIFFRLDMWGLRTSDRPETPMPPVNALHGFHLTSDQWVRHPDLAALKQYAADLVRQRTGTPPTVDEYLAGGYDNLPDCLPSADESPVEAPAAS
jgi:mono/diheme cytochrome c family protein